MSQKSSLESNLLTPNKDPICRIIERNVALTIVRGLVQECDGNFHFLKADIPFVDRCLGLIELSQSQRHSIMDITFGTGQPCSAR